MDDLIPTGQFSALTWLSPKALRLYQAQGLLEPAWIDPRSGYRYYSPTQVSRAARIALLRRAGISLGEIASYLDAPATERVHEWRAGLEEEFGERRRLLDQLVALDQPTEALTVTNDSTTTLQRAIPVLPSLDLDATQRFYADHFGFDPLFRYPDYAICARDGVQIHFWLTDDVDIPKETSCRIDVDGIDALYAEMQAAGVVHPNGQLQEQPWGMKEFAVLDGDGNLIKFAERTAPQAE
jgi:DNA-binding transcriptional MerR regulator